MQSVPIPTNMEFQETDSPNRGKVIIEPCYPGYGTTLGNALRRVLLSSLPGGAVTAFKVKNVQHEFSSIEHVKEDVVEITLNLKQLRLKVHSDQPVRIKLSAKGEKEVTGKDIEKNSDVEVVNPDLHIATLTDKSAELEMELVVAQGRGYHPTESREDETEVGMIAIDSFFNPVVRVNFTVDNVRVGQMTNWDKLVLDIETDGSITPREALNQSTQYLIEHFTFIETSSQEGAAATKPAKEEEEKEEETEEQKDTETEEQEEQEKDEKEIASDEKSASAKDSEKPAKKRGRPKKDDNTN